MFLLTLGLVSPGTAAVSADEHVVIILEAAYFPQKTTVRTGDAVRFVNESGREHTIFHASGKWATRPIADGEELLVTIEPDMAGGFYGTSGKEIAGELDLLKTDVAD
jgi:plastocyanin